MSLWDAWFWLVNHSFLQLDIFVVSPSSSQNKPLQDFIFIRLRKNMYLFVLYTTAVTMLFIFWKKLKH